MRLARVSVHNFRGFKRPASLEVKPGLNVLVGANGQVKSSFLNAVEWCLFGREVEKSSSGLVERKAWEVANRYAAAGDTVVRLVWELADGTATMTRSRPPAGPRTHDDSFEVELPSGELLAAERAAAWAREHGIPSWSEWRSSYCQHQEGARDRLLTKENRTAALVALLGLEEIASFKTSLDSLKLPAARKAAKEAEARLNDDLGLLQATARDLDEVTRALAARGVDSSIVTRAGALSELATLRSAADAMSERLGLPPAAPAAVVELEAALDWADLWPAEIRRHPPAAIAELPALRRRLGELEGALAALQPLATSAAGLRAELEAAVRTGGDAASRASALDEARSRLRVVDEQRKANSQLASLLADARALVAERGGDQCPVCETEVAGLLPGISRRLDASASELARTLDQAAAAARAALQAAQTAAAALDELQQRASSAAASVEQKKQALAQLVAGGAGDDVAAAARSAAEQLRQRIESTERLQSDLDRCLSTHGRACDELRTKVRYLEALARQDRKVDVTALPSWARYAAAMAGFVGLIADCDALAVMAKEVLASTSEERLAQVNRRLGEYFVIIAGDGSGDARALTVVSHSTARQLDYRIVDARGEEVVPILNQAALNAISMAMLFAQADGLSPGGLALLVLDDPEQSLDEDHVAGLARALDQAAAHRDILVGITPARLERRLRDFSTSPKHFHHLTGWSQEQGAAFSP